MTYIALRSLAVKFRPKEILFLEFLHR
jgi:hypothetical protein